MRFALLLLALAITGCATKQYGIAQPVSPTEGSLMDCNDVAIELERIEALNSQIRDTSSFDGRSVLGFLGDFGIGNAIARSEAEEASLKRENQLRALKAEKGCA